MFLGEGNKNAKLLIVGDVVRDDEVDRSANDLLKLALKSCMISLTDYYLTNIVKCDFPGNRSPNEEETRNCLPFLRTQFALMRPKIVLCLGSTASKYLISPEIKISKDRGRWINKKGCYFMPTYHPAALLKANSKKIPFFEDVMKVKELLDEFDNS